jgi:hypothetical protein
VCVCVLCVCVRVCAYIFDLFSYLVSAVLYDVKKVALCGDNVRLSVGHRVSTTKLFVGFSQFLFIKVLA